MLPQKVAVFAGASGLDVLHALHRLVLRNRISAKVLSLLALQDLRLPLRESRKHGGGKSAVNRPQVIGLCSVCIDIVQKELPIVCWVAAPKQFPFVVGPSPLRLSTRCGKIGWHIPKRPCGGVQRAAWTLLVT